MKIDAVLLRVPYYCFCRIIVCRIIVCRIIVFAVSLFCRIIVFAVLLFCRIIVCRIIVAVSLFCRIIAGAVSLFCRIIVGGGLILVFFGCRTRHFPLKTTFPKTFLWNNIEKGYSRGGRMPPNKLLMLNKRPPAPVKRDR